MKKTILIVDDSSTARALLKICFIEHQEYELIDAKSWEDAVAKAESHNPFLIFLDYNMPDKTGSELATIMQKKGIKAHYVLVTANTQQSILDEVKALGFFDVLEKPVSVEDIQSLLEKLI